MGNRAKDLQRAQQELKNLGRQGWFPHDLQRGRVLVLEVLKWMAEEDLPVSKTCYASMIAVEKSDTSRTIMRAVAAAEQAIRLADAPLAKDTRASKKLLEHITNDTYLDKLGERSALQYADIILTQIEEARQRGQTVVTPLTSTDLRVLFDETVAKLDSFGELRWERTPSTRRQVFTDAWYRGMQSKGLA